MSHPIQSLIQSHWESRMSGAVTVTGAVSPLVKVGKLFPLMVKLLKNVPLIEPARAWKERGPDSPWATVRFSQVRTCPLMEGSSVASPDVI